MSNRRAGRFSVPDLVDFKSIDGKLYIDDNEVLRGWESFSGWYWFATEDAGKQDSVLDGRIVENDQIWFGYVQGLEEEWGYFSLGESKIGPIPDPNLGF